MPNEYWLQRKFVYYYFIDKGITPKQVDEMDYDDVQIIMLINKYTAERHEMERKKQENRVKSSMRK